MNQMIAQAILTEAGLEVVIANNGEEAVMNGHLAKPYDIPKMLETLTDLLA